MLRNEMRTLKRNTSNSDNNINVNYVKDVKRNLHSDNDDGAGGSVYANGNK